MFSDVFDALLDQLQGSRMFKIKLFVLCVCALYKSQFLQKIFFSNCKQSCEGNLKKGNFKQDQWWSKRLLKLLVQHRGQYFFMGTHSSISALGGSPSDTINIYYTFQRVYLIGMYFKLQPFHYHLNVHIPSWI